jgi:ATP-binding cassette subfamily G (WHITE) protein 2 (SNQ2)
MSFLRTLADNGQAILCTYVHSLLCTVVILITYSECSIHQPSAELFQVFDRMLLLRKGGQTCYFGDIGRNATTLINYFERNGARKCLPNENP